MTDTALSIRLIALACTISHRPITGTIGAAHRCTGRRNAEITINELDDVCDVKVVT
ncbi:MAG: hypothetical protein ACYSYV_12445 [Planctomycetota bacterium]